MESAHVQIRRLSPDDAASYRDIRLEALQRNPEAFSSTFEAENPQTLSWFADRLGNANMFGAFRGAELVGIAGLLVTTGRKECHKGHLVAMYVRPASRNGGIGQNLVEAIVDFARQRVEIVLLAVVSGNEPARRLYARLGFVEYGIEKKALKHDGCYFDEVFMAKDLTAE